MAGPGRGKTGGRKKGTLNADTAGLCDLLDKAGYSPVAELIWAAEVAKLEYARAAEVFDAIQAKRASFEMTPLTESDAPTFLKIVQASAANIMPYVYPKRKAVEITGKDGADLFQSFGAIMKQAHDRHEKDIAIEAQAIPVINADP